MLDIHAVTPTLLFNAVVLVEEQRFVTLPLFGRAFPNMIGIVIMLNLLSAKLEEIR